MSVVVLQLGQGGNQYGLALFNALASSRGSPLPCEFFEESGSRGELPRARALLIDMEPKVVAAVTRKANGGGAWKYDSRSCFTLDSGSGNNWAAGYCSNGVTCREPVLEQIRLKVEKCDCFGGFLGIQSLAGGTGAGFGAYVLEALKDEYPSACIFSHSIWPFQSGEVVVQNYNVLLTLAKLHEVVDGIITVENDSLVAACKKTLGIPSPSFVEMNSAGAHALASLLLPSFWRPIQASQASTCNSSQLRVRLLSDLAYALCAHPAYRMLTVYSTPQVRVESLDFTTFAWPSQLKQLKRIAYPVELEQVPGDTRLAKSVQKSVASLLALRGPGAGTADVSVMREPSLYPSWCIDPLNVCANDKEMIKDGGLAAGMMSNCQGAILPASKALTRAYAMFYSKAYLHQYFKHGLDASFFEAAFATVEDVCHSYSIL
ncbi:hypothetical protein SELMODRAFT_119333 [Selaginella moellendorffii]|uniref:Tubulin delta chain n=1 Tax=Selaginella moellendorffii TaxID=88036 RepID=D8SKZ0_SELML|nr:tubulin delta chain isoform X2 [Selaginella moellendorffii]EFJ14935.1 hypothetical protein SELMODRAFT_119333 [Selaginella moellendorffii]|eukprot:XP_002983923.1 tubulin delta chain isoform X2 [Selaginella moellendorffii]